MRDDDHVERNSAFGVRLGVEENFRDVHIVDGCATKVLVHQVVEVSLGDKNAARLVVEVEKVLKILEVLSPLAM